MFFCTTCFVWLVNVFPEKVLRKEKIDKWLEPKKTTLGEFLLIWLCIIVLSVYALMSCPGRHQCVLDNWGIWQWPLEVYIPLLLFIGSSIISFPFVNMYWMYSIDKPWTSKKSNV